MAECQPGPVDLVLTRGAADRDFNFPDDANPSLVMFTQTYPVVEQSEDQTGIARRLAPEEEPPSAEDEKQ